MWDVGWIRVYPAMLFVLVLGMSSGSVARRMSISEEV